MSICKGYYAKEKGQTASGLTESIALCNGHPARKAS